MILYILIACFLAAHGHVIHPEVHHPQPYGFGYTIKDKESVQHREEVGNGAGMVKGNYGFIDNKGIHREVDYVADHGGFRAQVKTNEPGTAAQSPAAVHMIAQPHAHGYDTLPMHEVQGHEHHHLPAHDRYKFMTPLHEHGHQVPLHMPIHIPVHEHAVPHHIPLYEPFLGHEHHVPAYEHVPHHALILAMPHGLVAPLDGHVPVSGHHLSHLYGPRYMGGLAHSKFMGDGIRGHGEVVNHGKLLGGIVKGYDSRFIHP